MVNYIHLIIGNKQKITQLMLNAFILVSLLIVPALAVALSTVNLTLDEGNAKEFGRTRAALR